MSANKKMLWYIFLLFSSLRCVYTSDFIMRFYMSFCITVYYLENAFKCDLAFQYIFSFRTKCSVKLHNKSAMSNYNALMQCEIALPNSMWKFTALMQCEIALPKCNATLYCHDAMWHCTAIMQCDIALP